jgi:hypothetical protein
MQKLLRLCGGIERVIIKIGGATAEFRCWSAAWRCRPLSARGVKHVDNRRFGQKVILHKEEERKRTEKHSSRTRFALFDLLAADRSPPIYIHDAAARKIYNTKGWCACASQIVPNVDLLEQFLGIE